MREKLSINRALKALVRNVHPSSINLLARETFFPHRSAKTSLVHLLKSMQWLKKAHDACDKQGVSAGYSIIDGWLPPYPETTGYIIPTFYDYSSFSGEIEWHQRATAMADWEISVQMQNGAVQAGMYEGPNSKQIPAVFNTGQVILGWCRAYGEAKNSAYLQAAVRAGDWLVREQGSRGEWIMRGGETETHVHSYDVRTAWSLLELHKITGTHEYQQSALRNLEWVLQQQLDNGWFENNSFFISSGNWTFPFTHTIAYVLEGLQESFLILKNENYFNAYAKTAEKLLRIFELRKRMVGHFDKNWKSSGEYSCLTGNAQIAGVWLKHFEITGDLRFLNGALKLNDYTKSTQDLESFKDGIRGGIKGSQPIHGKYTPFVFPNWAAKFFADTLMLEEKVMSKFEGKISRGDKLC